MSDESAELCGIEGQDDEFVTIAQVNRFARIVNVYHGRPIKDELRGIKESMDEHIKQDEAIHNQIKGARYVLWAIGGILAFCVPLGLKILEALQILMAVR